MGGVRKVAVKLTEYICKARDEKGIKSKWLAEKIKTSESNFSHKLARDNLTAWEFMILATVLDIDLNAIKSEIADKCKKEGEDSKCILKD